MTSQQLNLQVKQDNKLVLQDYLKKQALRGFLGFSEAFESFMVRTGRIEP